MKNNNNNSPGRIKTFNNIILHLHPASVKEEALRFSRTFGLGGTAAFLIIIQFITGIMLRFYYEPFPAKAYDSILMLNHSVLFGQLIRNIHHWSAVFIVIIAFLHLLRVFLTGAFLESRRLNWIIGLILLILVVFSNFTGYLLPWDQLAYWAITVSTSILQYIPFIGNRAREFIIGGSEINADTLLIFYNIHTSVLPILLIIMMAWHFWRVRKSGGVILPDGGEKKMVPTIPHLVNREFVAALVILAIILTLSVFWNAPLLDKANPAYSLNPTKAPWYFAGIQELLLQFHPLFGGVIIPVAVILSAFALPYLKFDRNYSGNWFHSGKGKSTAIFGFITGMAFSIFAVLLNEYILNFEVWLGNIPSVLSNGLLHFSIWIGIIYFVYFLIKRKFSLDMNESVQLIFVFIVTIFIVLTLFGILFRGVDMELTFPWKL